jgi:cytochrome c-type biogenesis protein CcmH/NrfG
MSARVGVAVMAAALLLYIVLAGQRAVLLLGSGDGVGIAMGVALIVLPVLAAWALGRELLFGTQAARLGRRLEEEDALPEEELGARPSGRVIRSEAAAVFPRYRAAVEESPEDWRAWYRLGLAYDGAGDRRRARSSVRTAIRLERADRRR